VSFNKLLMAFLEVEDLELGAFHVEACTDSSDF
jgi:hypothetical protein